MYQRFLSRAACLLGIAFPLSLARGTPRRSRSYSALTCFRIFGWTLSFASWIKRSKHVGKEVCDVEPGSFNPFQLIGKEEGKHGPLFIFVGKPRDSVVLYRRHFSLNIFTNCRSRCVVLRSAKPSPCRSTKQRQSAHLVVTRVRSSYN